MCPSGDRTFSIDFNKPTFYMTNIVPQNGVNNQGIWNTFESYIRNRVLSNNEEVYVISGIINIKSFLYSQRSNVAIGIPEYLFKIVLFLPFGEDDLMRITENTEVISIIVPNNASVKGHKWFEYRVTSNDIEKLTNLDFMSNVPKAIQSVLKNRAN
jgi:endonuclease G